MITNILYFIKRYNNYYHANSDGKLTQNNLLTSFCSFTALGLEANSRLTPMMSFALTKSFNYSIKIEETEK